MTLIAITGIWIGMGLLGLGWSKASRLASIR